ncbi:hypothetical protein J1P26_09295 [Neobacillus sp. MM2021_6]|uniref:DUF6773 family protein n=1 Tax=Bacillaceae TaxID=186817 RepID=UPI001407D4B7|nr:MULTISPECIES: DUF6773 family protein [Bacillaceae]MBO0959920.1 hypothetical protein [Neobacillus sp. MM2021_6]NHC18869.1 hypothetical protein [Bacillus sp. MM2020_4]
MNIFKRAGKVTDERIENIRNKIFKEMYYLIMVICFISIGIKVFKYGVDTKLMVLELVILFFGGVYYLIRSIFLGVYWDEVEMHDRTSKTTMGSKTIFSSIGLALVMAIMIGVKSAVSYADGRAQGIWYFAMVSFASIVIYVPIFLLLFGGIHLLAKKISLKKQDDDNEL